MARALIKGVPSGSQVTTEENSFTTRAPIKTTREKGEPERKDHHHGTVCSSLLESSEPGTIGISTNSFPINSRGFELKSLKIRS